MLFLIVEVGFFAGLWWIDKRIEHHSKQICYNLTGSPEVVYVNNKCYLPNDAGNLDFVVNLNEI